MKRKVLIFHPYLAPYRIDFFNMVDKYFSLNVVFQYKNDPSQDFNLKILKEEVEFNYDYLLKGFKVFTQNIRYGTWEFINRTKPEIIVTHEFE